MCVRNYVRRSVRLKNVRFESMHVRDVHVMIFIGKIYVQEDIVKKGIKSKILSNVCGLNKTTSKKIFLNKYNRQKYFRSCFRY